MAGKYLLSTLGCKVNQYESQQIRELIESLGLEPAAPGEQPDIAIVNTCAVTADASRSSRRTIRRVSAAGVTPVIVVGCGATAEADRLRQIDGVTAVLGHDAHVDVELRRVLTTRLALPLAGSPGETRPTTETTGEPRDPSGNDVWMIPGGQPRHAESPSPDSPLPIISGPLGIVKTDEALIGRIEAFAGHQRAFLKVQDGCDAHCTYCIIPQLRRTLRSKPVPVAVAEAARLVRSGHKEIVITGIFLGAYGRPTAIRRRFSPGPSPLARLVEAVSAVEGLQRLRLSSLEPGDVDDDLLEVLATRPNCVPHLHLPLQSGSADVLRRMNRQYTRDQFVGMIDRVRAALDQPAISTDIIVGFPGESDADFEASVDVARYARFCKVHVFPFSPRAGTAAARWGTDFVPAGVQRARMQRLAGIEAECSLAYRRSLLGRTERVIVEKTPDPAPTYAGLADRYFKVWFDSQEPLAPGNLVNVRLDRVTPARTHGTLLPHDGADYPLLVLSNACE